MWKTGYPHGGGATGLVSFKEAPKEPEKTMHLLPRHLRPQYLDSVVEAARLLQRARQEPNKARAALQFTEVFLLYREYAIRERLVAGCLGLADMYSSEYVASPVRKSIISEEYWLWQAVRFCSPQHIANVLKQLESFYQKYREKTPLYGIWSNAVKVVSLNQPQLCLQKLQAVLEQKGYPGAEI